MIRTFTLLTFCLIACAGFFQACTADPDPVLHYKDRQVVDSLFKIHIDTMKPVLDSICDSRHDSILQFRVDSMMKKRQEEIDRYLERIKREQEEE